MSHHTAKCRGDLMIIKLFVPVGTSVFFNTTLILAVVVGCYSSMTLGSQMKWDRMKETCSTRGSDKKCIEKLSH
jgi:preprotein translocase subunit SecF